jgi:hypothetical protein
MADRTLYMDLNGKIKKGFEHGQKWQFTSTGKEAKYCEGIYELRQKVADYADEQGRTAEYWYNLAYKGM